jgi:hypothetical protein
MGQLLDEENDAPGGAGDQQEPGGRHGANQRGAEEEPSGFEVDLGGDDVHVRSVQQSGRLFITLADQSTLPHTGDSLPAPPGR